MFVDEFAQDVPVGSFPNAVAERWGAYNDGWKDTSGRGTYMPSRVLSVHDGVLDIYLHSESGTPLVSAPWPRIPGGSGSEGGHLAGRYVIRMRVDTPMPGYKFVGILWPDIDDNLRNGEIDFPEADLDEEIYGYVHRTNASVGSDQDWYATGAHWLSWHTMVIERQGASVTFFLDDRLVGRSTVRTPTTAMSWILQAETSLHRSPATSVAGHIFIDWVAAYLPA